MKTTTTALASITTLNALRPSFRRFLDATNKSPRTIETYMDSLDGFLRFLAERGMPQAVGAVRREHIEAWVADILQRNKPATASVRYRGLQAFWKWAQEEGEARESPMRNMKPPIMPETPVRVIDADGLTRLLRACDGKDWQDRRDMAMLTLMVDTGLRRAELLGLMPADLDMDNRVVKVLGKSRRLRLVPFGKTAALRLDRYLRARAGRDDAHRPELWRGLRGPLGTTGLVRVLRARARKAGLGDIHPHQLRHSFAHAWLAGGGNEHDLMRLVGWRSRGMVGRYAASAADERARTAYQTRSPVDALAMARAAGPTLARR